MPYRWSETDTAAELTAWPYRSLPPEGFVWFIGATAALVALPLLAVLGSPVLWGLLPFVAAAVWGVWAALRRNTRDAALTETLTLTRDLLTLTRRNPRGPVQTFEVNPYWVEVRLHPTEGPVEDYLTLRGGDREVELGAFLSPEERKTLHADLSGRLARLR